MNVDQATRTIATYMGVECTDAACDWNTGDGDTCHHCEARVFNTRMQYANSLDAVAPVLAKYYSNYAPHEMLGALSRIMITTHDSSGNNDIYEDACVAMALLIEELGEWA